MGNEINYLAAVRKSEFSREYLVKEGSESTLPLPLPRLPFPHSAPPLSSFTLPLLSFTLPLPFPPFPYSAPPPSPHNKLSEGKYII